MKKIILIMLILFVLFFGIKIFLFLIEDNSDNKLNYFTTDGCSMFFDGDWKECCVEHDKYYWIGGSKDKRKIADKKLKDCVINKGHSIVGNLMYLGVRIGGIPYLPTSFRWGYGWDKFVGYNKVNYEK